VIPQEQLDRPGGEESTMIDGLRVIDFHGHVGRADQTGWITDPVRMLHAMDSAGIDLACLFNIFHPNSPMGNDETAGLVAQHPNRFIGFAYVSPLLPGVVEELTRAIDELHFAAIKIYSPYTRWALNEPQWDPIYDFADQRGLTIIAHTDEDPKNLPKHLAEIAPRYPRANFVAAHSGNTAEPRSQAIAAARTHPNVYLGTCSTFRTPGVIEQLVNQAGADRVIFGSDLGLLDPRSQLGKIITADFSDEAKRKILGGNASRLLGI
jgi:hypothetical protein